MAQSHLSNDEFFVKLGSLIETLQTAGHGSVYLTQKRMTYNLNSASNESAKDQDDPLRDLHPANPLPVIIRATDGKGREKGDKKRKKKTKISTIVQPDKIDAFFARYAEVCKAGMQSLKKRDRSKRKKDKGKKKKTTADEKKS